MIYTILKTEAFEVSSGNDGLHVCHLLMDTYLRQCIQQNCNITDKH